MCMIVIQHDAPLNATANNRGKEESLKVMQGRSFTHPPTLTLPLHLGDYYENTLRIDSLASFQVNIAV